MKLIEWILMIPYYFLTQAEQKPDFTGILLIPHFLLSQAEQKSDFTGIYWSLDKRQIDQILGNWALNKSQTLWGILLITGQTPEFLLTDQKLAHRNITRF